MGSPDDDVRIAFVCTSTQLGGMQRVVCGLAGQFDQQGKSVSVFFPAIPASPRLLEWCADQGVAAEIHPAILDAYLPHTVLDILRQIRFFRDSGIDLVNFHYGSNFISLKDIIAARLGGIRRCYVTVHSAAPWDTLGLRKRLMTALASRLCSGVIAICGATRDLLLDAGVSRHKISTIYCGVGKPTTLPTRAEARRRLSLPPDAFVIATLARLVKLKGVHDLIEACALVDGRTSQILLEIGGDGPERSSLEALASARLGGSARFFGPILDGTDDFYAAADLFVLPSHLEGFPLVYQEAAFHGVPSIGTRVGGTHEAIIDGETGYLVPPGAPGEMARVIGSLLENPDQLRRLGAQAKARAERSFTLQAMARAYFSEFGLREAASEAADGRDQEVDTSPDRAS